MGTPAGRFFRLAVHCPPFAPDLGPVAVCIIGFPFFGVATILMSEQGLESDPPIWLPKKTLTLRLAVAIRCASALAQELITETITKPSAVCIVHFIMITSLIDLLEASNIWELNPQSAFTLCLAHCLWRGEHTVSELQSGSIKLTEKLSVKRLA